MTFIGRDIAAVRAFLQIQSAKYCTYQGRYTQAETYALSSQSIHSRCDHLCLYRTDVNGIAAETLYTWQNVGKIVHMLAANMLDYRLVPSNGTL